MASWNCYMDDTIAYVKIDAIVHVLSILNSVQGSISFTYEQETNGKSLFWQLNLEEC